MAEAKYRPILINKNKSFCIDIAEGKCKNGTPIILYQYHGGKNQKWYYDGSYIRSAMNPRFVIDVQYSKFQNGTKLQVWEYNGSKAQQWDFNSLNEIVSRGNRKYCIDLHNATPKNCQKIHLVERRKGGHAAQKWTWAPAVAPKRPQKRPPQKIEFVGVSWYIEDTMMANTRKTWKIKTGYNNGSTSERGSTNERQKSGSSSQSSTKKESLEWSVDAKASGGFLNCSFEASAHTGGASSKEKTQTSASASQVRSLTRSLNTATQTAYGETFVETTYEAMPVNTYILLARIEGKLGNHAVYIHTRAHQRWPCDKPWPLLPPINALL